MLDKVGDKQLPVADKSAAQHAGVDALDMYTKVAEQQPALAAEKRSVLYYIGKFFLAILQAILMIAILAGAYTVAQRMIAEKPEPRKRRAFKTVYTVETVTVKPQDYRPVFTSYGQTVAARTVDLRALVSGEIIKISPNLSAGSRVTAGESLVEIDRFNYQGALAEAQANLDEARARIVENDAQIELERSKLSAAKEQLEFAEADFNRVQKLLKRRTSTQQQVEARKLVVSQRAQSVSLSNDMIAVQQAKKGQLQATIDRLQWRVDQAKRNLDSAVLKAPFTGIVRSSTAEIGRAITANDVVVSLYEADTLEVRFTLTDAQYGRLQATQDGLIGRNVEVVWSIGGKDWSYPAKIERLGAEISSDRGGVQVFARLGEYSSEVTIRPGAFVEVRVPDRLFKNAYSVPDAALYGTDTVYTEVDGKLVENKVNVAAFDGETAIISSGLKPDDKVLATRITEVSAGLNVRREGEASKNPPTPRGRPSPEEIAKILKANNLTAEEFRAMPVPERRKLIQAHRAANR